MRPFAAVIFDMDGVLFDSEPLHLRAWQIALAGLGVSITIEEMMRWIGFHDSEFALHCHRQGIASLPPETLVRLKRARYFELAEEQLSFYPGVAEGIRRLCDLHIPIAVGTSSSTEEMARTLGRTELFNAFRAVITGDDTPNRKPAPDTFLLAATRLRVDAASCLVIEDSPAGVTAGNAAGCTVLAVTTSYPAEQLKAAHHIFSTTAHALAWIFAAREDGGGGRDSNPR